MICNSTTTKTSKHHSCSLNHKHTGNLISFLTWLSTKFKLQSTSTPAEPLQIHPTPLTQIVTQVYAEACGRGGQNLVKFRIFCWRNGRILRKNAKYHKPIAAGSHEVSGSIPLISTRKVLKSHDFRAFSLLSPANNRPHLCSHAAWPRFDRNRQTTPRMDRHETIVTGRCETFRYYRYWRISKWQAQSWSTV